MYKVSTKFSINADYMFPIKDMQISCLDNPINWIQNFFTSSRLRFYCLCIIVIFLENKYRESDRHSNNVHGSFYYSIPSVSHPFDDGSKGHEPKLRPFSINTVYLCWFSISFFTVSVFTNHLLLSERIFMNRGNNCGGFLSI